jgi:hypothetical protein
MSAARSPKYPSIPLQEALELAGRLWQKERKTPVGAEQVGQAWGYKGDSGPVRSKIGALRQYGLLDGTREGVKISDLALEIIVNPAGSRERAAAVSRAALSPPLFLELYNTHAEASADSLRAHLITKKGFNPDAANQFVSSFKSTIALAEPITATYDALNDEEPSDQPMNVALAAEATGRVQSTHQPASAGTLWLKVPFRGTELSVRIDAGQTLTKEHLARVRKYLELAEDDLGDEGGDSE